jgi:hypothetical protein
MDVLVPLIQILCQDVSPTGVLAVAADLRGPGLPEKAGPRRELPVRRPIRGVAEWYVFDTWLRLRADLHDGSVLELAVTDRIRNRQIRKVSRSGRHKSKMKHKRVQLIRVTRILPKGLCGSRPASPPPPWIRVRLGHGGRPVDPAADDQRPEGVMGTCAVTTGVFVLRRCTGLAVAWCSRCRRPLCSAHVAEAGCCPECAAATGFGAGPGASPVTVAARHRRAFRARSSAHYRDPVWYSSLDDFDRAAFAPGAAGSQDYDPDDGSALVDS